MLTAAIPFWTEPRPLPPVRKRARSKRAVPSIHALAELMLDELRANRLEVVLVPDRQADSYGNDFRRLRAVQSQNPAWYREFCGRYESRRRFRGRKFKTRIKRRETERALVRIVQSYAFTRELCDQPEARRLRGGGTKCDGRTHA